MPDISKGASGYSTAFLEDGSPAVAKQPLSPALHLEQRRYTTEAVPEQVSYIVFFISFIKFTFLFSYAYRG